MLRRVRGHIWTLSQSQHPRSPKSVCVLQKIEFHVLKDEDVDFDLEVLQRVYVRVKPMCFMGFDPDEV